MTISDPDRASQRALFGDEPVLADVRVCWGCGGNGESVIRSGPCTVCHDGCGWLSPYDPATAEIPF